MPLAQEVDAGQLIWQVGKACRDRDVGHSVGCAAGDDRGVGLLGHIGVDLGGDRRVGRPP